jgi:hypothetical protein
MNPAITFAMSVDFGLESSDYAGKKQSPISPRYNRKDARIPTG